MEILSLIFKFSHSIEVSERILSCMAAARIIPANCNLRVVRQGMGVH